jgi:hypothetical protein
MKRTILILFCLAFIMSLRAGLHSDDYAISYCLKDDPRKWSPAATIDTNGVAQFVLEGDSIKTWKEMVTYTIRPNQTSVKAYVETWKKLQLITDPKTEISEEALGDDSFMVTCTSPSINETSIQKFIKRENEVSIFTYHVRTEFKKDDVLKIWSGIIRAAKLVPSRCQELAG